MPKKGVVLRIGNFEFVRYNYSRIEGVIGSGFGLGNDIDHDDDYDI